MKSGVYVGSYSSSDMMRAEISEKNVRRAVEAREIVRSSIAADISSVYRFGSRSDIGGEISLGGD